MDGKVVKALPVMEIKKSGSNTCLLHGINVSSLPTGVYNFEGTVSDTPSNKKIHFSRQFEIIQMDYLNSQSRFTDEQAQTAANYLKYIVSPEQYKMYESLNLTGKAQFLVQFWKDNDPTPGTPENEYLEKIKQRYNYANNHFRWGKEKGWASDRGRVLIKYGNPDDVERHLLEPDTDPYEIWYYHTEKNYEFVFADLKGDGQFALIHSTKEGEVSNPNWQELVNK
jgi:GWxTD domain-containing protein